MFVSVLADGSFSNADDCFMLNVFDETDERQIKYLTEIDYPDVQFKMADDGYLEIRITNGAAVRII